MDARGSHHSKLERPEGELGCGSSVSLTNRSVATGADFAWEIAVWGGTGKRTP
jgi:hypothetical protein